VLTQAAEIMGDIVVGARPAIPSDSRGPQSVKAN
jgi:hypothetical protein